MIADLNPYPAMKDSGVEWLGEVPEHWDCTRLGNLVHHRPKRFNDSEETPVLSLTTAGVRVKKHLHQGKSASSYIGHQLVDVGELVFTPRDFDQTPILSGVAATAGCTSNLYFVVAPRPAVDIIFVDRYLWGLKYKIDYFRQFSEGMRYSFSRYSFNSIPALLPPVDEQVGIVRYLDYVDRRVRRLVRAKRKLVALLTEQKQVVVHRAVTRGLDPDAPMKDSGVEWLGEVPAHWELKPNRAYLQQRKVLVGDRHNEYTLLSLTKQGVIVRDLSENKGKFSADMGTSQEVRRGDLVMCLFDVPETPRTVGLSRHDGMITSAYTVFEVSSAAIAQWFELFYIAMDDRKALGPLYSGLRNTIPKPRFLGAKTPVPPSDERARIVDYINKATADADKAITRAEREIELLNEYRTRLIADVVTGKLDVREASAALPDEEDVDDAPAGGP